MSILRMALFICGVMLSSGAYSCGCNAPSRVEEVRHYAHIFEGEVISVMSRPINDAKFGSYVEVTVAFRVRKMIAGPSAELVTVSYGGNTSCDLQSPDFIVGQVWLISDKSGYLENQNRGVNDPLNWKSSGAFFANFCSLRKLVGTEPLQPPKESL